MFGLWERRQGIISPPFVKNMRREIIARRKRQQRIHGIATVSALILTIITPQIVNKIVHPIMDKINKNDDSDKKMKKIA